MQTLTVQPTPEHIPPPALPLHRTPPPPALPLHGTPPHPALPLHGTLPHRPSPCPELVCFLPPTFAFGSHARGNHLHSLEQAAKESCD